MIGLTVKEAAKVLGVSASRVYRLVSLGRIRTLDGTGQPRQRGRYAKGGFRLDEADVERVRQGRS